MKFASWAFRIAAIYGIVVTTPMFFIESRIRPPVSHPEQYYGFLGLILVWQIAFWLISTDVLRYRPLMAVAVLEKASFAVACGVLFGLGRIGADVLTLAGIDAVLGVLFAIAYLRTPRTANDPVS